MSVNWKRCSRLARRVTRATVIVATVALGIQFFARNLLQGTIHPVRVPETTAIDNSPMTVWELIRNDNRTSTFANILGQFTGIAGGLNAPKAQFTVYVPTNEAFEQEKFAEDLPIFYWMYLVGYHMGPGAFTREMLSRMNTAPSFVFADIYQKYRQRISLHGLSNRLSFNYRAHYATADYSLAGVNGHVHLVDRVLMLPESTSDLLRDDRDFSTLREGLTLTDVAVTINDTSTHVGQTLFAPSNAAFDKLGAKTKKFLFSPGGRQYLKALLEYHVVANRTMFTDIYFQESGRGEIPLQKGSTLDLPTLVPGYNLSISIDAGDSARPSPLINNEVRITQSDLVVMDGVVHKLDTVLLPPRSPRDDTEGQQQSWFGSLVHWVTSDSDVKVGELVRRLEEFMDGAET
ncbi:Fasciclin domain family protein [Aspergillus steynii IBT 23096]|uniref:Fasciclin domain family protein n=1 Tax=Aspergillus steynii IBT 23096 TaxID=1392250 RepID=A0A2I2G6F3_9EURO|nr:Fasciclin domain family protein [Aspergillus steynii IBT 23096]PLB48455.1 Fasciclin domain family protein [Aspergillus steynii IBT 23096]